MTLRSTVDKYQPTTLRPIHQIKPTPVKTLLRSGGRLLQYMSELFVSLWVKQINDPVVQHRVLSVGTQGVSVQVRDRRDGRCLQWHPGILGLGLWMHYLSFGECNSTTSMSSWVVTPYILNGENSRGGWMLQMLRNGKCLYLDPGKLSVGLRDCSGGSGLIWELDGLTHQLKTVDLDKEVVTEEVAIFCRMHPKHCKEEVCYCYYDEIMHELVY